jgi:hypothetical protein
VGGERHDRGNDCTIAPLGEAIVRAAQLRTRDGMRLSHVMLILLLNTPLALFCALGFEHAGLSSLPGQVLAFLIAFPTSIIVAGPLSRLLGMPPLMIFSGPCPNCGERPRAWGVLAEDSTHFDLACAHCASSVRLWLRLPTVHPGCEFPEYRLRWPTFLGLWTRRN